MNLRALAVILALAGPILGCAPLAEGGSDDMTGAAGQAERAHVEVRERSFLAALANRDAEATAAHFADDAMLHIANMPTIEGRPAIQQFYGNVFRAMQASDAVPDRIRVSAGGDMAWSSGQVSNAFASTEGSDEGPVAYTGRYLLVWERRADEWLIVVYSLIQQPGESTMETRERVTQDPERNRFELWEPTM